jgi:hypothetical protein
MLALCPTDISCLDFITEDIVSSLDPDILNALFEIASGDGICYSTGAIPTAVFSCVLIILMSDQETRLLWRTLRVITRSLCIQSVFTRRENSEIFQQQKFIGCVKKCIVAYRS